MKNKLLKKFLYILFNHHVMYNYISIFSQVQAANIGDKVEIVELGRMCKACKI